VHDGKSNRTIAGNVAVGGRCRSVIVHDGVTANLSILS
jgi:hypothetical protein